MENSPQDEEKIDRLRRAMYSRSLSSRLKDRPRREMDEESLPVSEEWRKEMPPPHPATAAVAVGGKVMSTIGRWLLITGFAFLIGAVAFLAYYFTIGAGSQPTPPAISISAPTRIAGGEPTKLQIVITNNNRAALDLADLVITFPLGTHAPGTTDEPERRVAIGTSLDYELVFSSSSLSISVESNTETVSGQQVLLTVTVASNAPAPVNDVLLKIDYPFGFAFSSGDPRPERPGLWALGNINPGERVSVTLRGTLTGEEGDERIFRTSVGTRKDKGGAILETVVADYSHRMVISQAFLSLSITVQKEEGSGSPGESFSGNPQGREAATIVAPGESVNVSIEWKNNLSTAITDAVIVARLSGIEIDGASVRSTDGYYRSSDSAILWDKTTTGGSLSSLPAGGSGTVGFSFQVPQPLPFGIQNPSIVISTNAAGKRLSETGVPGNLRATASKTLKLASELEVAAQGLYYENPFVSTGPLPPRANQETTYAILFTVTNTTNAIQNARLTAQMPPYVRSLGMYKPEAGEDISFNVSDGSLTWRIGDIASGVGISSPIRWAEIAVGFTPSTSQIGEEPVLLQGITLTGIDSATGAVVTKAVRDVTTNIIGDRGFSPLEATVVR
ncbi:MAG: hypothetical protein UY63_C0017G0037 [Parcubacteria group bacterium GW2011_GWA2_51_10]|nr:MAG: hypothetical protein UY63_C0017G0037 [Parcubacteria group bacterium GW2011_GWA2_51_10]